MASDKIDDITAMYTVLQSMSAGDLEDTLEQNICCTQAMQAQIADEIGKLQ